MSASAIYEGFVSHRRLEPREHRLRHRLWMVLVDLDELPEAFSAHPLWSARRPAPVRFRADDLLRGGASLAERARTLCESRVGRRPAGPVRVLTMPRVAGVGFNPVSLIYLHGSDGRLDALITEVTNTPWGERHRYVVEADDDGVVRARLLKELHVSPFMPMDQTYRLVATEPADGAEVRITSFEEGRRVFDASLSLRRRELNRREMSRVLLHYPPPPAAALAGIYAHALRLRAAGLRLNPRPAVTS